MQPAIHLPSRPDLKIVDSSPRPGAPKKFPVVTAKAGSAPDILGPAFFSAGNQNSSKKPADGLLTSWKDISAYLSRGVRTTQRWEQTLGLPVHRMGFGKRAPVFAFQHEIDSWLRKKGDGLRADSAMPFGAGQEQLSSRQKWLIQLVQQLRATALELEQWVAADGHKRNADVTDTLRKVQDLVNRALARSQPSRIKAMALGPESPRGFLTRTTDSRFKTPRTLKPRPARAPQSRCELSRSSPLGPPTCGESSQGL